MLFLFVFLSPPLSINLDGDLLLRCFFCARERRFYCTTTVLSDEDEDEEELDWLEARLFLLLPF